MAQLVALDYTAHRDLRIDPVRVEAAGATLNMVPVVLSEFLKLVVQYPIAFTKDKDTGRFVAVALFGFHDGENLFASDAGWDAIYVPLQVARQPFFLGDGTGEGEYVVCIDPEHASIGKEGEAIFDAAGSETPYLESVKQGLADLVNGAAPTAHFIETLAGLKLLTPMALDITFENLESTQVEGLYTINEARLADLSATDMASLHARGLLAPIYTMLASLGHIYAMIERRNRRARLA